MKRQQIKSEILERILNEKSKRWHQDNLQKMRRLSKHAAAQERGDEIFELHTKNIPIQEIAKKFGVSKQRIYQIIKTYKPAAFVEDSFV